MKSMITANYIIAQKCDVRNKHYNCFEDKKNILDTKSHLDKEKKKQ